MWCYRTSAMLCYPLQRLTTRRGGSIDPILLRVLSNRFPTMTRPVAPNLLKRFLSKKLVLSIRCAAVLSIANTDNKEGRLDSTTFSARCRLRKFGAIEPLHSPTMRTVKVGSMAPNFHKFSEGSPFTKVGVIEPLRGCVIHCKTDINEGRFDSTIFCQGCRFRKFGVIEPFRCPNLKAAVR